MSEQKKSKIGIIETALMARLILGMIIKNEQYERLTYRNYSTIKIILRKIKHFDKVEGMLCR